MLFWSHQNHPVDQVIPSDDYSEVGGNFGGVWWRYCRHTGPNRKWRPEAHFELKSDVLEIKRRNLARTKPKTAVVMHAVSQGQQENKASAV